MNTQALADTASAGASVPAEAVNDDATKTVETEAQSSAETNDSQNDDADAGADDASEKRPSGYQRMRERATRAQIEAEQAKAELAQIKAQLGDKAPIAGLPSEPKEADFTDFFEYQAAKAGWYAEKMRLQTTAGQRDAEVRARQVEQQAEIAERVQESEAKARKVIDDYDKVTKAFATRGESVSPELVREVFASDKAALINYHLCKPENAGLLRELNGMSGSELVRAVGRLEGRLNFPRAKTATNAPPPVSNVSGGTAASFDPNSASHDQFKEMFARK